MIIKMISIIHHNDKDSDYSNKDNENEAAFAFWRSYEVAGTQVWYILHVDLWKLHPQSLTVRPWKWWLED